MLNPVEYVREICRQRNIPISKLESDCGFGNGYLNPKKLTSIPYHRAVMISEYLSIPLNILLGEEEKAPTPEGERNMDNGKKRGKRSISRLEDADLTPDEDAQIDSLIEWYLKNRPGRNQ